MLKPLVRHWTLLAFLLLAMPAFGGVIHEIDFTKVPDGKAIPWLKSNGWGTEKDADDLNARFEQGKLVLAPEKPNLGILLRGFDKGQRIKNAKKIRIEWGVEQYPKGADWEKGVFREAVGIVITFGEEKIDSGKYYIPNVPYFIGLFLGDKEAIGKSYTGEYYKQGGRYVCTPCQNEPGKTVITEFELQENFKKFFKDSYKGAEVPEITGISIDADTRDTEGKSKAFIKKIQFLDE